MKSADFISIGIDLGGTRIKAVAISKAGRVLRQIQVPTRDNNQSFVARVETIRDLISRMENAQNGRTALVGIASPGMITRDRRCVALCPGKLKGIEGFDWTSALSRKQLVPLINDAHAALLGEHWVGAAKPFQHVVLLTLGTGVGGAVIEDGRLIRGRRGWAGLLGYMSLGPFGPKSYFTVPNPLEEWIGNRTVISRSGGRFQDTKQLTDAARDGDEAALAIWRKSVRALAAAIASFGAIFDPEAVIIGGGIASAGAILFKLLDEELAEVEWRPGGERMKILPVELGEWSGAIGAARNAIELLNDELPDVQWRPESEPTKMLLVESTNQPPTSEPLTNTLGLFQ